MPERSRTPARIRRLLADWTVALCDRIYDLATWLDPGPDPLEPEPEVLEWLRRFDDANQGLHCWPPARRYDDSDNLEWFHLDGSRCGVFWSDRPRPSVGRFGDVAGRWWCTEHQQYLTHQWAGADDRQSPSCTEAASCERGAHSYTWPCDFAPGTGRNAAPELLEDLRAAGAEVRVTPDLDAYAAGLINASQIRCVLCGVAPCVCEQCATCKFTKQARYNGCPRGCEIQ